MKGSLLPCCLPYVNLSDRFPCRTRDLAKVPQILRHSLYSRLWAISVQIAFNLVVVLSALFFFSCSFIKFCGLSILPHSGPLNKSFIHLLQIFCRQVRASASGTDFPFIVAELFQDMHRGLLITCDTISYTLVSI